jgi:inosine-uridine nucleoside N-ribohydrolase
MIVGPRTLGWLGALLLAGTLALPGAQAQEKVILDTDFNVLGDDGQVFIMAAQLDAEGAIDLLGLTMVSGNQWHDQGMVDALKAVERMRVADRIMVYPGSHYPLLHDQATYEAEKALFGHGYAGAWRNPKPTPADLKAPPDGMAESAQPADQHAVDFIIEQVKAFPHEVTLLVIGPVTNIALAVRKDPEIVPLLPRARAGRRGAAHDL